MPNKIRYTVQTANTTKPVEYFNPFTNEYQDTNPLTNIPAGSYTGLKARLKGSNPPIVAAFNGTVVVIDGQVIAGKPRFFSLGINSIMYDVGNNLMFTSESDDTFYMAKGTNPNNPELTVPELSVLRKLWGLAYSGNIFHDASFYGQAATDFTNRSASEYSLYYKEYGYDQYPELTERHFHYSDTVNTFNKEYDIAGGPDKSAQQIAEAMLAAILAVRVRVLSEEGGFDTFSLETGTDTRDQENPAKQIKYTDSINILRGLIYTNFPTIEILDTWNDDWIGEGGHNQPNATAPNNDNPYRYAWRDKYHYGVPNSVRHATIINNYLTNRFNLNKVDDLTTITNKRTGDDIILQSDSLQACDYRLRLANGTVVRDWLPYGWVDNLANGNYIADARYSFDTTKVVSKSFTIGEEIVEEPETSGYVNTVNQSGYTVNAEERALANAFIKWQKAEGIFGTVDRMPFGYVVGLPTPEVVTGGSVSRITRAWGMNSLGQAIPALEGSLGSANLQDRELSSQSYVNPSADNGKGAIMNAIMTVRYDTPIVGSSFGHIIRARIVPNSSPTTTYGSMSYRLPGVTTDKDGEVAAYGDFGYRLTQSDMTNQLSLVGNPKYTNDGSYVIVNVNSVVNNTSNGTINGQSVGVEPASANRMNEDRIGWGFDTGATGMNDELTHYLSFNGQTPTNEAFERLRTAVDLIKSQN